MSEPLLFPAIYKFTNKVNGKIYIGQSKNITTRLRTHLKLIDKCPFRDDAILYGLCSFKFEVLEFIHPCDDINTVLDEREQYFIDVHVSMGLNFETMFYNDVRFICDGSYKPSDESRRKMSQSRAGVKLSSEHINSLSAANKRINAVRFLKGHRPTSEAMVMGRKKTFPHILQYDLDGWYMTEHESQKDAAINIGKPGCAYNINKALKGVMDQAYGFQWRYHTVDFPMRISSLLRKIRVLDYDKNEIAIFDSPTLAAKHLGINPNRVFFALNDSKYNYSGGYYFYDID